jgi:hypothetical protein
MSSLSRPEKLLTGLDRADRLKRELSEFATTGSLKQEFERQQKLFFESSAPADETEHESLLDWFLFDWFDELGQGAIDHFLEFRSDHAARDREVLLQWKDSINSIFEIRSLGKNTLTLLELDTNDSFLVATVTALDQTPFQRGQCIGARLLPFGERFIFSGLQCIMPNREAAQEALEMRRRLEALMSPEALEKAQREQCTAFCEFFGQTELTVTPSELSSTLGRFQHYLFEERRNPATGKTRNEEFRSQFGHDFQVPQMPALPRELLLSGDVTILCDEFDGLVLLPDYNRFRQVFETTGRETPAAGWQDLVWRYIKDPEIPIVAFERVAETHPRRVEKVFRELLGDKGFSLDHLYAVLLHYKEPVAGMEDLKDDQRLWDFFDGTKSSRKSTKRAASRKPAAKAKRPAARSKRAPAKKAKPLTTRLRAGSKTNRSAKKAAAKKSPQKKRAATTGAAARTRRKAKPLAGTRSKTGRTASSKSR